MGPLLRHISTAVQTTLQTMADISLFRQILMGQSIRDAIPMGILIMLRVNPKSNATNAIAPSIILMTLSPSAVVRIAAIARHIVKIATNTF
jgi:hypothetical protein